MTVNQIYSVLNSINKNTKLGYQNVVDSSTFVDFGKHIINSTDNVEKFYNALVDRIGRTVIAIDEFTADNRIMVDSFTFGCILQKISFKMQDATANSDYAGMSTPNASLENPYSDFHKGGIIQSLFDGRLATFEYTDTVLDYQLESAFVSPQAMASFFNGIYQRMKNAYEQSKEELQNTAFATAVLVNVMGSTLNANTRKRNVLLEYNALNNAQLTRADAEASKEFLAWVTVEMELVIGRLAKLTSIYNDGTVERVTKGSDIRIDIVDTFAKRFETTLAISALNSKWDNIVKLPNYRSVSYWQFINQPELMSIIKEGSSEDYGVYNDKLTAPSVIGVIYDKDAVVCTLEREREVSFYDKWNARTNLKISADRRYIADGSENMVVFYMNENESRYNVTLLSHLYGSGTIPTDGDNRIFINGANKLEYKALLNYPTELETFESMLEPIDGVRFEGDIKLYNYDSSTPVLLESYDSDTLEDFRSLVHQGKLEHNILIIFDNSDI